MPNLFAQMFVLQAVRFRYLVLMCSLLVLVIVPSILHEWSQLSHLLAALFCIVFVASVPAVGGRWKVVFVTLALAVPAMIAVIIRAFTDIQLPPTPGLILRTSLTTYTAAVILFDIFKIQRVTSDTIRGAICVYLLLGITWAMLHNIVAINIPGSFDGLDAKNEFYDFTYFSFVTLTTLGYGDIVPLSPPARMLCWLESLSGQLFVAVLIARFVGLHGRTMQTGSSRLETEE